MPSLNSLDDKAARAGEMPTAMPVSVHSVQLIMTFCEGPELRNLGAVFLHARDAELLSTSHDYYRYRTGGMADLEHAVLALARARKTLGETQTRRAFIDQLSDGDLPAVWWEHSDCDSDCTRRTPATHFRLVEGLHDVTSQWGVSARLLFLQESQEWVFASVEWGGGPGTSMAVPSRRQHELNIIMAQLRAFRSAYNNVQWAGADPRTVFKTVDEATVELGDAMVERVRVYNIYA